MADIKYYDVILKPVITEKSMNAMGEKKYTFLVHPEANKSQIKEAVEKMFEGTKVKSVNTMNMDGKQRYRDLRGTLIPAFSNDYVHESTIRNSKGETSWESKPITHIHLPEDI